jgi:hypothetical protein
MSRRSTPKGIDAARRAAVPSALIGEGATPETADAWIGAWESKAAEDGLQRGSAYWQAGWVWVAEQRQQRVRPDLRQARTSSQSADNGATSEVERPWPCSVRPIRA